MREPGTTLSRVALGEGVVDAGEAPLEPSMMKWMMMMMMMMHYLRSCALWEEGNEGS